MEALRADGKTTLTHDYLKETNDPTRFPFSQKAFPYRFPVNVEIRMEGT